MIIINLKYQLQHNPSIRIYVNKIEIELFKIKTGYCLELLPPETMNLLGSTQNKITKNNKSSISSLQYCQM